MAGNQSHKSVIERFERGQEVEVKASTIDYIQTIEIRDTERALMNLRRQIQEQQKTTHYEKYKRNRNTGVEVTGVDLILFQDLYDLESKRDMLERMVRRFDQEKANAEEKLKQNQSNTNQTTHDAVVEFSVILNASRVVGVNEKNSSSLFLNNFSPAEKLEMKRAFENNPKLKSQMIKLGITFKGNEVVFPKGFENTQEYQQVQRYIQTLYITLSPEYTTGIDAARREEKIQLYLNTVSETGDSVFGKEYLGYRLIHSIREDLKRDPDGPFLLVKDGLTAQYAIRKFPISPNNAINGAANELPDGHPYEKLLKPENMRTEYFDFAISYSIIERNNRAFKDERFFGQAKLVRTLIAKHHIKGLGDEDLQNPRLLLADWDHVKEQIVEKRNAYNVAIDGKGAIEAWDELDLLYRLIEKEEYLDTPGNETLFDDLNRYGKRFIREKALIDESMALMSGGKERGPGGKIADSIKDNFALIFGGGILMAFLGGDKKSWGGMAIISAIALIVGGELSDDFVQELNDPESRADKFELIKLKQIAPTLNVTDNQQKVFEDMIAAKNKKSSLLASRGVKDNGLDAIDEKIGVYTRDNSVDMSNAKLGIIFETATKKDIKMSFNKTGNITDDMITKVYDGIGGTGNSFNVGAKPVIEEVINTNGSITRTTRMEGGHDISKSDVKIFLSLLQEVQDDSDTNLKDALTQDIDIENTPHKNIKSTGIQKIDDKLNEYTSDAWNKGDAEKRREVQNLQDILERNKFAPKFLTDIQNHVFEGTSIGKIDLMIAEAKATGINKKYIGLLHDAKAYITVANDRIGYRANPISPTNIDGGKEVAGAVLASGRNLLASIIGTSEPALDGSLEILTSTVEGGDTFARGFVSMMVGLVPDWKGGQDAVDNFFAQRKTDTLSGAAKAPDRTAIDVDTSKLTAKISADDKETLSSLFKGMGNTVDKKIEDFEKMKKKLTTGYGDEFPAISHPEMVEELLEKVEADLNKLKNLKSEIEQKRRDALGLSYKTKTEDELKEKVPGLMDVYDNAPEKMLRDMAGLDTYMLNGNSNNRFGINLEELYENENRKKIIDFAKQSENMAMYILLSKSITETADQNDEQKLIHEMAEKFEGYVADIAKQSENLQELYIERDTKISKKIENLKVGAMEETNNKVKLSTYALDLEAIQDINTYIEKRRMLSSILGEDVSDLDAKIADNFEVKLKEIKKNAKVYLENLDLGNTLELSQGQKDILASIERVESIIVGVQRKLDIDFRTSNITDNSTAQKVTRSINSTITELKKAQDVNGKPLYTGEIERLTKVIESVNNIQDVQADKIDAVVAELQKDVNSVNRALNRGKKALGNERAQLGAMKENMPIETLLNIRKNLNDIQDVSEIARNSISGVHISTVGIGSYESGEGLFNELAEQYLTSAEVSKEAELKAAIKNDIIALRSNTKVKDKIGAEYRIIESRLNNPNMTIAKFEANYFEILDILTAKGINETEVLGNSKKALDNLYAKFK